MNTPPQLLGVSLFSGAGIGDVGLRAGGIKTLAACELEPDRASLLARNFPNTGVFVGDIRETADKLCDFITSRLRQEENELFLVSCTAPCQGMSKNGQGTLLKNAREGKRPEMDPRNRLILPALDIIRRLRPLWVVFENVIEMRRTVIEDQDGRLRPIPDIICTALAPEYEGGAYDVEMADYGVPQRRQRLITVYTRMEEAKRHFREGVRLVPETTHASRHTAEKPRWVSVAEALRSFPALDALNMEVAKDPLVPFHRVPVLEPKKYQWVRHTALGTSAFDNQCVNPACRHQGNSVHGTGRDHEGRNRAFKHTPLYCEKCGELLPRPYMDLPDGTRRLMSGFTSAYKRMHPDRPSPTLTRNLSYACSDQKLHPFENRVLSLAEAMTLHTLSDYPYQWGPLTGSHNGKTIPVAPDGLIRLVIGESIPPRFMEFITRHILWLSSYGLPWVADRVPKTQMADDKQPTPLVRQMALWP